MKKAAIAALAIIALGIALAFLPYLLGEHDYKLVAAGESPTFSSTGWAVGESETGTVQFVGIGYEIYYAYATRFNSRCFRSYSIEYKNQFLFIKNKNITKNLKKSLCD